MADVPHLNLSSLNDTTSVVIGGEEEGDGLVDELTTALTSTRNRDRIRTLFTKTGAAPPKYVGNAHLPLDLVSELVADKAVEREAVKEAGMAATGLTHPKYARRMSQVPASSAVIGSATIASSELRKHLKGGLKQPSASLPRAPVTSRRTLKGEAQHRQRRFELTARARTLDREAKKKRDADYQQSKTFARDSYAHIVSNRHKTLFEQAQSKKDEAEAEKEEDEGSPPSSAQLREWYDEFIPKTLAYRVFDAEIPGAEVSPFVPLPPRQQRAAVSPESSVAAEVTSRTASRERIAVRLPDIGCHGGGFRFKR
mmetsp:Transcript_47424/g.122687  ORF Transcript_47424/g.122687 Transcript_47424/m.122687 type:complete len:312 (+) Transcript_47424:452-1387(+)